MRAALAGVAMLMAAGPAAAQYLETVPSPVFEAEGDRAALTRRAATCFAANAGTSGQSVQTDVEGGTVSGPALISYSQAGVPWSVRSTLIIEAKDGRFRMTHSGLTQKQGGPAANRSAWAGFLGGNLNTTSEGGWMPVGKWRFSGGEKAEAAAQALSQKIATCVQTKTADEDW